MNDQRRPALADLVSAIFADESVKNEFFEKLQSDYDHFNSIWGQDAEQIGRVLRAHLAVEYFLTKYLTATAPGLADIDGAKLGFPQKVDLISEKSLVGWMKPGLKRLNSIRNRLAHRLKVDVDQDDRNALLSSPLFAAMRTEASKLSTSLAGDDPLSVLEQFARQACSFLSASASPPDPVMASLISAAVDAVINAESSNNSTAADQAK